MTKFEYMLKSFSCRDESYITNYLNELGEKGWELVNWTFLYNPDEYHKFIITNAVFKRKIKIDS
ncbi:MAG: hypothetical protein PHY08_12805 [Candidatus Cloacimonetes bacterium]|jgi:hypothetical protein|nr:hypothetical protein [Candidatus Cloacimonadota bacterium]